jgi:hypothetical protein
VGASRRTNTKVAASEEEDAMTLVAPFPTRLASDRVGEGVVAAPDIAMRVRRTNTKVDASKEEALAFVAPTPVGLAGARVTESIAAAGAIVVGSSRGGKPPNCYRRRTSLRISYKTAS